MSIALPIEELHAAVPARGEAHSRSLRSNFGWTLAGNIVYTGCQWGVVVLLARLGRPEDVGTFSLGLAITAPVMLFAGLQLRAVQATDALCVVPFADYAGTRTLTTAAAALLIGAIAVAGYHGATAAAIAALACSKAIESLSDIVYGLFQLHERMDLMARSLMLRGALSLAAAAACFALWRVVWIAVCGVALSWAAVFAWFDLPRAASLRGGSIRSLLPRYHWPAIRRLLGISLPLGIVTMLASLNSNVPRYLIGGMRGVRELGIFSALSYILLAGGALVNALGQSATPRLAACWAGGRTGAFRKLTARLLALGLLLGAAGVLVAACAGRPMLTLLYGAAYANHVGVFVWLMIAAAFTYLTSFAGYALTAARYFRCQVPLFAGVTAFTLGSCAWLVKGHGARGAAEAMAAAGLLQLVAILAILGSRPAAPSVRVP